MKHLRRPLSCLLILLACLIFAAGLFPARAQEPSVADAPIFLEKSEATGSGYAYVTLLEDHTIVAELPVKLSRQSDTVAIVPARDLVSYVSKSIDVQKDITFVYTWEVEELRAPVKLSQKVGEVEAYLGKTLLDKTDLVTNYTVSKSLISELFEYIKYIFLHPVTLILLAFLIAFSVMRLLRGARKASAIKAGKFVPDDEEAESTEAVRQDEKEASD